MNVESVWFAIVGFDNDSGAGLSFAVSGESTTGFGDSSEGLGKEAEGFCGVLGLGFVAGAALRSGGSWDFIVISEGLALVGDNGLGASNCDGTMAAFGASCRNCDRRFISSLRGDDGCDPEPSISAFDGDNGAASATFVCIKVRARFLGDSGIGAGAGFGSFVAISSLALRDGNFGSTGFEAAGVGLVAAGVVDGAFLRGPRARPFVICVSCGPGSTESVIDVLRLAVR